MTGTDPVPRASSDESKFTYNHHPGISGSCTSDLLEADQERAHTALELLGLAAPISGGLLKHFLGGTGSAVRFSPHSSIASEALHNREFIRLNDRVLADIRAHVGAHSHVTVPGSSLTPPDFALPGTAVELRLGFGGTQGVTVTGRGHDTGGVLTGTLTYTIEDSYGFSSEDAAALPYGNTMRELQTICGAPQIAGGAHWFPDSITVVTHFREKAPS